MDVTAGSFRYAQLLFLHLQTVRKDNVLPGTEGNINEAAMAAAHLQALPKFLYSYHFTSICMIILILAVRAGNGTSSLV
jgi:hypothetical protein